jgi:uncharacterized protein YlxW (UPF0749 family)
MRLKYKRDINFMFLIAFVILGIMVAVQFRSVIITNKQKAEMVDKISKLRDQAKDYDERIEDMKKSISENEKKRDGLLKEVVLDNRSAYLNSLYKTLEDAKLKAGLLEVAGPGIIIQMNDAAEYSIDPRDYIIHDKQLVKVINELKKAGAQAISIDGERIMGTRELVCAGPTVRINKNRYPVPYEIKAIGDPDTLLDSVNNSAVVVSMLEYKIRITADKADELVIPQFMGGRIDQLISAMEVAKDEIK